MLLSSTHACTPIVFVCFFLLLTLPPPRSTLFPYTTLFRSRGGRRSATARGISRRGIGQPGLSRTNGAPGRSERGGVDRKSTRLNSSHVAISYAVFCLKKKKREEEIGNFISSGW